jgi:hypothetical protein
VTVLWHSVAVMYLSPDQRKRFDAAVDQLGSSADADAPVAHLTMEPVGRVPNALPIRMRTFPHGEVVTLGQAAPHGPPVVWGT